MVFFVLCFSVNGQEWIYNTKQIKVNVNIDSGLEIIHEKNDYIVEEVGTLLHIFPREYDNQKILNLNINPEAEMINDSLYFSWKNINQNKFEFDVSGELRLEEALKKVNPSITKEIIDAYAELQNKFSQAKARELQINKPNYFG